jgi:hypothetical protein
MVYIYCSTVSLCEITFENICIFIKAVIEKTSLSALDSKTVMTVASTLILYLYTQFQYSISIIELAVKKRMGPAVVLNTSAK